VRVFRARVLAEVPPARAFDFVADYHNVRRVLDGVSRWEPLGRARGAGARFDVEMRTFGIPLRNVLVLDRWDEPRALGWRSESGLIEQRGGWTFTPRRGGTEIELEIAYQPPGAAIGNLLAGRADALVRHRLEKALQRVKRALEG
jgi:ribosome-associated toxin RatA of RatAB toxin-antitoxin module